MKIGILTFHASHNYGSMLQAYALQRYLHQIGYKVEIINLRIDAQRNLYNFPLRPIKGRIKWYIKSFLNPAWIFHECKRWYIFENFLKQNLQLTGKEYKTWETLKEDLPELGFQCIITGGDQIWNMMCRDFCEAYYLPIRLEGTKKISYCPSFGDLLSEMTDDKEIFIRRWLSDYYYLSVREQSMQEYLSNLLEREVDVTVDPTLLLSAKDYSSFISDKPLFKGKYIFYYLPGINPEIEDFALRISRQMGLPIVTSYPHIIKKRGFSSVHETGPSEFLNLIKNAAFVIGKSFHLIVFALLFHKEFIAIDGDKDTRIRNFLSMLSLSERGKVTKDNYQTISLPAIDFERVDKMMDEKRNFSRNKIKTIIESPGSSSA